MTIWWLFEDALGMHLRECSVWVPEGVVVEHLKVRWVFERMSDGYLRRAGGHPTLLLLHAQLTRWAGQCS